MSAPAHRHVQYTMRTAARGTSVPFLGHGPCTKRDPTAVGVNVTTNYPCFNQLTDLQCMAAVLLNHCPPLPPLSTP